MFGPPHQLLSDQHTTVSTKVHRCFISRCCYTTLVQLNMHLSPFIRDGSVNSFCIAVSWLGDSQKLCYRKPIFNRLHTDDLCFRDLFFTSTISPPISPKMFWHALSFAYVCPRFTPCFFSMLSSVANTVKGCSQYTTV